MPAPPALQQRMLTRIVTEDFLAFGGRVQWNLANSCSVITATNGKGKSTLFRAIAFVLRCDEKLDPCFQTHPHLLVHSPADDEIDMPKKARVWIEFKCQKGNAYWFERTVRVVDGEGFIGQRVGKGSTAGKDEPSTG